ncbi:MAG: ABC transporter ATP-binding protein, partial [Pseudomonadota bacterium]
LFPHMTVAENIGFPLKLRKVPPQERDKRIEEALETVQLAGLGHRNIDQLSGGQRQRVALARAFVFAPRILLMDEPLSALDKKLRERMQIELKQLHRKLGVTTVYVTHDQREALTMSDRIAVINDGELIQVDTPEGIYNAPANEFVADFIGESTILPLQDQAGTLHYRDQPIAPTPDTGNHGHALVIRPERLSLDSPADESIAFKGTVRESVYQGETAFVLLALADGHEIGVRYGTDAVSSTSLLQPGTSVDAYLQHSDVIVIPAQAS